MRISIYAYIILLVGICIMCYRFIHNYGVPPVEVFIILVSAGMFGIITDLIFEERGYV